MRQRTILALALGLALLIGAAALAQPQPRVYLPLVATPPPGPQLAGCPVFPADNAWNRDISASPVDPRSADYIAAISADGHAFLHPDFGSNPDYGIPYVVVPASQPLVPVSFVEFPDESDPGPYPLSSDMPIEGGGAGDSHVLVLRQGECKLYELYHASYSQADGWQAGSGAVWDLRSNALRPAGWTSADAAGLPILPGLVRRDEVLAGEIRHALRFTVWRSQQGYILPATHAAGATSDPSYPPMGLRLRLKAGYNIAGFSADARVILEALRRYGMIVADNGSSWYISGASDAGWNDDALDELKRVPGDAFEVVQTGAIVK
jgi:hypothetical protein